MNPQVLEFANRLMEGADTKDLPSKAQANAEALARQYGWQGQGAITPKEKILVNEAGAKLQQLFNSNSLAILDRGAASRMKVAQALKSADKQSVVGTGLTALATVNLDPQEQEFIRLYNAAAGTIAGLGPITRGNKTHRGEHSPPYERVAKRPAVRVLGGCEATYPAVTTGNSGRHTDKRNNKTWRNLWQYPTASGAGTAQGWR
jgi:hypothetical protein